MTSPKILFCGTVHRQKGVLGRKYSPLQHTTHKKSNLGARDYSCAVSGFGQALPLVTLAEDLSARSRQRNVQPHARKKKASGAGAMESTLYLKKTCLLGRDVHVKNLDLSAINKDKVK